MVRWARSMAPVGLRSTGADEALLDAEPFNRLLEVE
jgi:hypothetical protein